MDDHYTFIFLKKFFTQQTRLTIVTSGTIHPTPHGGIRGGPKASIPESHEFDLHSPLIMARSYAVTSIELSGGVFGGVLVSGFLTFSASDEGLPLLSCNSNPLLVNEGWEGLTFSGELGNRDECYNPMYK